mmetsp:Transcript_6044/g.7487  ORF Transcript_6044/g.7487 Transcript_6044/m.7487 type:complete len:97 (+) Transcript_6044:28-318(+)
MEEIESEKKQVQFQEGEAKTLSIGNLVRSFQDDKPSISDAMKNLLSVLMAEDVTAGPDDLSQKDNPAHLLACAKESSFSNLLVVLCVRYPTLIMQL